jgi:hypothetical protein
MNVVWDEQVTKTWKPGVGLVTVRTGATVRINNWLNVLSVTGGDAAGTKAQILATVDAMAGQGKPLVEDVPECLEFEAAGRALALVHGIEVKRRGELEYKLVLAYPDEVLPLLAWEFEAYMKRLERAV